MEKTWRRACFAAALTLLGLTAWQWHQADVARPGRIDGVEEPTAILLLQAGDCPDRRAAVLRWLEERSERTDSSRLALMVGYLAGGQASPDGPVARLPRLEPDELAAAERALLRAGVEGTPALLLVDATGTVVLADHFTTTGLGARADVVGLLETGRPAPVVRADEPEA